MILKKTHLLGLLIFITALSGCNTKNTEKLKNIHSIGLIGVEAGLRINVADGNGFTYNGNDYEKINAYMSKEDKAWIKDVVHSFEENIEKIAGIKVKVWNPKYVPDGYFQMSEAGNKRIAALCEDLGVDALVGLKFEFVQDERWSWFDTHQHMLAKVQIIVIAKDGEVVLHDEVIGGSKSFTRPDSILDLFQGEPQSSSANAESKDRKYRYGYFTLSKNNLYAPLFIEAGNDLKKKVQLFMEKIKRTKNAPN